MEDLIFPYFEKNIDNTSHLIGLRFPYIELLSTEKSCEKVSRDNNNAIILFFSEIKFNNELLNVDFSSNISLSLLKHYKKNYDFYLQNKIKIAAYSTQKIKFLNTISNEYKLPYPIYSDYKFQLKNSLNIPVKTIDGMAYFSNLSIILEKNIIKSVFVHL